MPGTHKRDLVFEMVRGERTTHDVRRADSCGSWEDLERGRAAVCVLGASIELEMHGGKREKR